jgi:hypothetical protein
MAEEGSTGGGERVWRSMQEKIDHKPFIKRNSRGSQVQARREV